MKWLTTLGLLLYLSGHSDAGALKCSPESQEPWCLENRDISPQSLEGVKETASGDTQCLAGSEWESNCHYCRCSDSGVAECLKDDACDFGVIAEPIKCKPNTTFERDCNICTCLENGLGLCTLRTCLPERRRKRQADCTPGTTWKNDCNTCRCMDNGLAVCTRRACIHPQKREASCTPGTSWKNDCNTCWCTEYGASCTRMACIQLPNKNKQKRDTEKDTPKPVPKTSHTISKRGVCKSNQEFQVDCNPCKCAANGLSYTCTHNECLEGDNTNKEVEVFMENEGSDHIERHSVCKPRTTFYINCNICHCNTYGTDYTCTNKACPLPKDVEVFHELIETSSPSPSPTNASKTIVCVANRMFIRDCNTCWCNEDGTSYFCTRRVCIPESTEEGTTEVPVDEVQLKVVKEACRPNEVFELDCNMCRCNPDGKSYSCTRRACVEVDDKNSTLSRKTRAVQEGRTEQRTCQPDLEFRMDCNMCLCDNEGLDFSCTRNDCTAVNNNGGVPTDAFAGARSKRDATEQFSTECTPGAVFDRDCNVCRCTEDGLHATCTLKPCKREGESTTTESAVSFRCTPGDQFKRDCNDCTCSADGKSFFCTLRICDLN